MEKGCKKSFSFVFIESMESISGYNVNDFFYVAAKAGNYMPSDNSCNEMNPTDIQWDTTCNEVHFTDNRDKCIQKELCINKSYGDKLIDINNGHYGKDEKYLNTAKIYMNSYKTSFVFATGIIALGYFIYNNRVVNYVTPAIVVK